MCDHLEILNLALRTLLSSEMARNLRLLYDIITVSTVHAVTKRSLLFEYANKQTHFC